MEQLKQTILPLLVTLTLLNGSCTGSRHAQLTEEGATAWESGDYGRSLEILERIIREQEEKGTTPGSRVYALAGMAAFELGMHGKSTGYLESALNPGYPDERAYQYQVRNYRKIDNLSKEINVLTAYLEKYPEGEYARGMRTRLFETCRESGNISLADELWPHLDSASREDVAILQVYLHLSSQAERERLSDSLASVILQKDPANRAALEHMAYKYYRKAEDRYQKEMKDYKENRTHGQYSKLLEAFKTVTSDFKTARDYYGKLYGLNPDPEYATFLGNIYTRLDDEKTAGYYYSQAGKKQ